jgi:hypothetical protein
MITPTPPDKAAGDPVGVPLSINWTVPVGVGPPETLDVTVAVTDTV